jgi:hypothetical protein
MFEVEDVVRLACARVCVKVCSLSGEETHHRSCGAKGHLTDVLSICKISFS